MPTTPYVSMLLPIVSSTLGPEWASEINDAFELIDAHDHSSGKGVPVRPAGLYMDADLDFRSTNPKNMRSARFALQSSLLGGTDDVCCLYFQGADLYTNDAAGNQIQITSGGGIAGSPGSISGLASPASVVYTPGLKIFNFYSDSLVRAALACGPLTIADAVASGKGVTISAPSGLISNYALELPAGLPASTQVLTLSPAGLIAASGASTPIAITPASNWSAGPGGFTYWKDAFGVVHIAGYVIPSAGSGIVFGTLPAGYRPNQTLAVPIVDNSAAINWGIIDTSGDMSMHSKVNGIIYFWDSVSFLAS
jgi:hypothetical protein